MSKYRIMTFDGGGVRAGLTVVLLKRLVKQYPDMIEKTDFFAGTSTGSFIALGLAYGISLNEMGTLFSEENTEYIFSPKNLELFKPKYNNRHLKKILSLLFPEKLRLSDLKHKVLIPSFRTIGHKAGPWSPVFFNNFADSPNKNARVIDVALCSSAAPVYFPSYNKYIDGGMFANNPSTAAVAKATDMKSGKQEIDRIFLMSFGTGYNPHKISADTTKWGAFEWAFSLNPPLPLLSILFDGISEVNKYLCNQFLGDRFLRINPILPEPIPLDDYKSVPDLIKFAKNMPIKNYTTWIKKKWY